MKRIIIAVLLLVPVVFAQEAPKAKKLSQNSK